MIVHEMIVQENNHTKKFITFQQNVKSYVESNQICWFGRQAIPGSKYMFWPLPNEPWTFPIKSNQTV